jgi:hypothetical protein
MAESTQSELEAAKAEIERLKAENAELVEHEGGGRSAAGWIRSSAVVLLFAMGFLLVPTAGMAVWGRNTLLDTDRYVETVAPLSDEQQVIDSVAQRVTDAIFAQIDVEAELEANLPPRLAFAAGPITSQIESTTNELIVKALETDQFDTLWREVNRQTSEALVAFVKGEGSGALTIDNGQLFLELGPILDAVKSRLLEQGVAIAEKIPTTTASVQLPVADVSYLEDLRSSLRALNALAYVLPWLAAACFIAAVLLSRDRRRGLVWSGLLISGAALLVGASLALGRASYLDAAVAGGADPDTAAVLFDTLVRFLRNGIRVFFVLGLVLAIGAVITGPSAWATKTRRVLGGAVTQGGERTGWDTGAFGAFVAAHRVGLQVSAAAVLGAALFLVSQPTPSTVLWLAVLLLVVVGAIQFLAATAPRVEDEPSAEGDKQEVEV